VPCGDAGAAAPARPVIRGRVLGALIGAGGTAGVWSDRGDAAIAIKVPRLGGAAARDRALAEAEAMRLAGGAAPRLVEVTATDDGRPALVMERVAGPLVADVIADAPAGGLGAARAVALGLAIAEAVAALHRAGLVHRDLKPDNLVVEAGGGRVRVLDLGLALGAHRGPAGALTSGGVGTVDYAAPEQLRGDPTDARADVYALGAIVFELLAMRPPFLGDAATVRAGHLLMWPPRLDGSIPPAVAAVVERCLRKDPSERPADAGALAAALAGAARCRPSAEVTRRVTVLGRGATVPSAATTVALLAIDGEAVSAQVGRVVAEDGGVVVRLRRGRALAMFEPHAGSPLDRAVRAAERLVAAGPARVVVHVASVELRPGTRLVAVGDAIERPESWLPSTPGAGAGAGVVLSAAAAAARWPVVTEPVEVRGRELPLAALGAAMAAAFAGAAPGPTWIVGPAGSGRGRLLRAAARRAQLAGARAIAIDAGPRGLGALARALGVDAVEPLAVMAALGAAARARPLAVFLDHTEPPDHELAALLVRAAETTAFWLCIAGDPDGAGARRVTVELGPLDPEATDALIADAFAPCEVPAAVRARLALWTERLPGAIVELAAALRAMGVVRRVPGSALWELDAAVLDAAPASVTRRCLAERQLAALPAPLAELARIAAALGIEVDAGELTAVLHALVAAGAPADGFVDPETGVAELARRGVLVARGAGAGVGFRGDAQRAAIAAGLVGEPRRAVHRAALELARAATGDAADPCRLRRIALHAGALGDRAAAIAAHVALARLADARHAMVDAEHHLNAALELTGTETETISLLLARARARRLSTRYEAAREDASAALALARTRGDAAGRIEALLSLAAIADQTEEHAAAAGHVAAADALAAAHPDAVTPRLAAFLHNRRGVVARRAGRIADAARELEAVRALAPAADGDVVRGSLLLLSRVLAAAGTPAAGLAVLDEALAACERDGDLFHLVAGLLNRVTFWSERGELARAVDDAERGRRIARDMGFAQLAIWIDHNLSCALWWAGDLDAAIAAARRAHDLGVRRFAATPTFTGTLQLAIYLAATGRTAEALPLVDRVRRSDAAAGIHGAALELVELACGLRDPRGWDAVLARAAAAPAPDHVEVLWLHAAALDARGDHAGAAAALRRAADLAHRHGGGIAAVLTSSASRSAPAAAASARSVASR
jgi:tetratricopeptide (TPR) repeat protein